MQLAPNQGCYLAPGVSTGTLLAHQMAQGIFVEGLGEGEV